MIEKQIQKIIDKEINNKITVIKSENIRLNKKITELSDINDKLNTVISDLQKVDLFSKYVKNVTNENLSTFLTFIFNEKDNIISNTQTTIAPMWFLNLITYWSNKDVLFKIYDILNIKYPKWAMSIQIPYEWSQDLIDLWFNTLSNHYVGNGCIFDNNLGFWLGEYQNKTVEENLKKQYSDVPWQLVLKNPLFLKEDNFKKLLDKINNSSHGEYFSKIGIYQKLTDSQIERLVEKLIENPNIGKSDYTVRKSLIEYLPLIKHDSHLWDRLYELNIYNAKIYYPDRFKKKEIIELPNSIDKLSKAINSKLFTKKELDTIYKELYEINR